MSYSYSLDGDVFCGEYDTPEDAALNAFDEDSDAENVRVSENVPCTTQEFINGQRILEVIVETAFDALGDVCEGWLDQLQYDEEKCSELSKLIADWIEAYEIPNFSRVRSIKGYTRADLQIRMDGVLEEEPR